MKNVWNNLTTNQKYYVAIGSLIVVAIMIVQFVLLPFFGAKARMDRSIAASEKTLADLRLLGSEYSILKQKALEMRHTLTQRPRDFALFSYLERKAGEVGVKTNIKYMNSLKGKTVGPYEEVAVDMQLEKLVTKQVTDFLHAVESPKDLIKIRKVSIQKMKDTPEYLSISVQVVTYQNTQR